MRPAADKSVRQANATVIGSIPLARRLGADSTHQRPPTSGLVSPNLNSAYRGFKRRSKNAYLDRFRSGIHGSRDIVGCCGERLARLERDLLVFCTDLANDVMPAVVPRDAGLAVHHRPGSMVGAEGFVRLAISLQSDVEISRPGTLPHPPFANK